MKNSTSIFTAVILLSSITFITAFGQTNVNNKSRFGIKGGINLSSLYTKGADKNTMLAGFNIGVYDKIPITNMIAFQPELYYTTKGAEVKYNNAFVDGTARFRLNYIEVPLLIAVNVTPNINIHFGPYFSYLISGKVENQTTGSTLFDFEKNINTDDYNRFDAGIVAGAGIDIGTIGLGLRYNYGLTKVGKDKTYGGTNYMFPDAKNGVLNAYISFSLN